MASERLAALHTDWREAYFDTESAGPDDQYTLVTAVYEHPETGVKAVVRPDEEDGPIADGHTEHAVTVVYPVYEDIGIPDVFRRPCDDIRPFLNAIVPEVHPRKRGDDDPANYLRGPYKPRDSPGDHPDHKWSVSTTRRTEPGFEWESLPEDAIAGMETYKQMPYDYQQVLDDVSSLMTVDSIAREEPGLIDEPYEVTLYIGTREPRESDADVETEYFVASNIALGSRMAKTVGKYVDYDAIEPRNFDEGTELATVKLEFQFEDFPYDPDIVEIDVRDEAHEMRTLRGILRRIYA